MNLASVKGEGHQFRNLQFDPIMRKNIDANQLYERTVVKPLLLDFFMMYLFKWSAAYLTSREGLKETGFNLISFGMLLCICTNGA